MEQQQRIQLAPMSFKLTVEMFDGEVWTENLEIPMPVGIPPEEAQISVIEFLRRTGGPHEFKEGVLVWSPMHRVKEVLVELKKVQLASSSEAAKAQAKAKDLAHALGVIKQG